MANIKELKKRIKSTKSTLKITSAMKLVSAAKLSKAQAKIMGIKQYADQLDTTIKVATALNTEYKNPILEDVESPKKALIIVSSNKGLCGGYNSQLYKSVKRLIMGNKDKWEIFAIGRKIPELLKRDGISVNHTYTFKGQEPTYEEIKALSTQFVETYLSKKYQTVSMAHNSFISALEFNSNVTQILPLTLDEEQKTKIAKDFPFDFIYEGGFKEILDDILPESFNISVYAKIMDAIASEHGARMTAMDNATNNSKDMIRSLNLKANKLRQAAITTELTEIVSGAESLK